MPSTSRRPVHRRRAPAAGSNSVVQPEVPGLQRVVRGAWPGRAAPRPGCRRSPTARRGGRAARSRRRSPPPPSAPRSAARRRRRGTRCAASAGTSPDLAVVRHGPIRLSDDLSGHATIVSRRRGVNQLAGSRPPAPDWSTTRPCSRPATPRSTRRWPPTRDHRASDVRRPGRPVRGQRREAARPARAGRGHARRAAETRWRSTWWSPAAPARSSRPSRWAARDAAARAARRSSSRCATRTTSPTTPAGSSPPSTSSCEAARRRHRSTSSRRGSSTQPTPGWLAALDEVAAARPTGSSSAPAG